MHYMSLVLNRFAEFKFGFRPKFGFKFGFNSGLRPYNPLKLKFRPNLNVTLSFALIRS